MFGLVLVFALSGGVDWQVAVICWGLIIGLVKLQKAPLWLQSKWIRIIINTLVFVMTLGLFLHLVPGFNNVQLLNNALVGTTSTLTYDLFINYDKALVGLFILFLFVDSKVVIGEVNARSLMLVLSAVAFILLSAGFILSLKYDPKWLHEVSLAFILVKTFSTAFAEEIVFRGWIQGQMQKRMSPVAAWLGVSVFFGLVHMGAGLSYLIAATIAGFVYGYIFMRYRSLLLAGVTHGLVNIMHFCFLTYPM